MTSRVGDKNPNWKGGPVQRTCETCGKSFTAKQKDVRAGFARFCSRKCWGLYRSIHFVGERGCNWQGGEPLSVCEHCGASYPVTRHLLNERKFCSQSCYIASRPKQILVVCSICGESFYAYPSQNKEFCSLECKGLALSGQNSPNWNGGTSFEPYPATFNKHFKAMIRSRDAHTCQICGANGHSVHHINYAKDDTSPGNCITLCRKCHGRTNYNRTTWRAALAEYQMCREMNGYA